MATRETRVARGSRMAQHLRARALTELRSARVAANVSQRAMAAQLGWSHTRYARFESASTHDVALKDVCQVAALLGLEMSVGLHPFEDPISDRGQLKLGARFRGVLSSAFRTMSEVLVGSPAARRGEREHGVCF